MSENKVLVVVGGGIAGMSCIETLFQHLSLSDHRISKVVLISESNLVKRITNFHSTGRNLETFDVTEENLSNLSFTIPAGIHFETITGLVDCINYPEKRLIFKTRNSENSSLSYDILCLCSGSRPRHLDCIKIPAECLEKVVVLRDTTTIKSFEKKLERCRRLLVVGNGGISLELVAKISNCDKIWLVRNDFIGSVFFDSEAGKFFLDSINSKNSDTNFWGEQAHSTNDYSSMREVEQTTNYGPALGPGWSKDSKLQGTCSDSGEIQIIYQDEIKEMSHSNEEQYPLKVLTLNGKQLNCDLIALAIGVQPNRVNIFGAELDINSSDGGILIDNQMRTSLGGVYAAGDIVSCEKWSPSDLWFQMRLWTQARQMGAYTARCILSHTKNQDPSIYFNFDCFTHCTSFFGYRVVLLGKFNGQFIDSAKYRECEAIVRMNPGKDYTKILLLSDKIIGAILVGNCGMEETIENLIHDAIDVGQFKDRLLDDSIDIDDFFD